MKYRGPTITKFDQTGRKLGEKPDLEKTNE